MWVQRTVAALAVATLAAGCSAGSSGGSRADSPAATSSSTPSAAALPTEAQDALAARTALLEPSEAGDGWVQVSTTIAKKSTVKGKKGEYCPGVPNPDAHLQPRVDVDRTLTLGRKPGADILSTEVMLYTTSDKRSQFRDALTTTLSHCHAWRAVEGNYVVAQTLDTPPSVEGADNVLAEIQRVYADKGHKQLQYVRQTMWVTTGRALSIVQLAYLTNKKDPNGDDTTRLVQMAHAQSVKAASAAQA